MAAAEAAPDTNVLFLSNDPLVTGLIQNEARPEANLTGVTFRVPADRTLSLATRAVPGLERLGLLFPATDPAAAPISEDVDQAAADLDLDLAAEPFEDDAGVGSALARLRSAGVDAVLLANAPATVRALPALAEVNDGADALPLIANTTAVGDALMVLQPDSRVLYRQIASQAARLLDGVPVAEVPVQDPGQFLLVLNQRVAARLGVELPDDLLAEADEVIP
jgi:putative ABC transport system substrate-binding protein